MMPMPPVAPDADEPQEAGPLAALKASMQTMKDCMAKMEAALAQMEPEAMASKSMARGFAKARPMSGM